MNFRLFVYAATVLSMTIVACGVSTRSVPAATAPYRQLLKLLGGTKGFAVLLKPERVDAFRLDHMIGEEPVVKGGPAAVGKDTVKDLTTVLSAPESFLWNIGKGCIPVWGVRFSFFRGDDRLEVLLCFNCDILGVRLNDGELQDQNFDRVRPQLVRLVKAVFPDDPVIQKLAEARLRQSDR
jgi:hypothetical protein